MKAVLLALTSLLAGSALARPNPDVVQSCLMNQSVSGKVQYEEVNFDRVDIEEDSSRSLTATTIYSRKLRVGKYERSTDKSFGIVYGNTKVPAKKIQALGRSRPAPFQVELAMYGIAKAASKRYLCITFNFEGLGQSGSFQNVRGLYLIETSAKPLRTYYTVGDVRTYLKQP